MHSALLARTREPSELSSLSVSKAERRVCSAAGTGGDVAAAKKCPCPRGVYKGFYKKHIQEPFKDNMLNLVGIIQHTADLLGVRAGVGVLE